LIAGEPLSQMVCRGWRRDGGCRLVNGGYGCRGLTRFVEIGSTLCGWHAERDGGRWLAAPLYGWVARGAVAAESGGLGLWATTVRRGHARVSNPDRQGGRSIGMAFARGTRQRRSQCCPHPSSTLSRNLRCSARLASMSTQSLVASLICNTTGRISALAD